MNSASSRATPMSVNAHELHGMACGLLCVPGAAVTPDSVRLLRELTGLAEAASATLDQSLAGVLEDCRAQMAHPDHVFEPLLPEDDDANLDARAVALARWCEGFLAGFGAVAHATPGPAAPAEQAEILEDLAAISRLDPASAAEDDGEWDFFELKEYVRMAVLSLFLDQTAPAPQAPPGAPLH